ncbi:glycoside hydrolase family 16 protein [Mucilaginibacter sp. RS28]|uniref:Glycoside hydrolase family 16 protein n=1 Tax=Mucilaginibacter straminoryzae TaxID=2932774 RepID=A0A9X1X4N5_9SPHI|nr:glycoside hydrolase family 16 protein [Mucilaginibacter straminoryzae]MCJ8211047.1 glycoside hydrolase family 16 protein [Mucilaginibacter straminoryzae]
MAISWIALGLMMLSSTNLKAQKPVEKSRVIFFEDFSASKLDRSRWNVIVTDKGVVNNEQQAYVDSSATLYIAHGAEAAGAKDGALVINPVYHEGYVNASNKRFDFLSGRIDSRGKVSFTYGTVSARMKLPAGTGLWPAFWMLGEGKWPDCGEIDIMENIGEPDWISAALHGPAYFGETPLVNKLFFKNTDITQWHVYTVEWSKNALLFKVDNQLYYRVTRPMVENYGPWAFDNPKFLILNLALGGAYPAKINGVKAPYNGLPETTVKLIKQGKAKVLVDWVKVTQ